MENINRIIVVCRGTASSVTVIHSGVSLAKKYGAKTSGMLSWSGKLDA